MRKDKEGERDKREIRGIKIKRERGTRGRRIKRKRERDEREREIVNTHNFIHLCIL